MNIDTMTKKDFENLPKCESGIVYRSFIVIPINRKHDSGYRCMKFVLCRGSTPLGIVDTGTDSVQFCIPPSTSKWNMDCLYKSKLLRFWCNRDLLYKYSGSTFEVDWK